jgi:hypothetical protein
LRAPENAATQKNRAVLVARIGKTLQPISPGFNRSLRVETRADRLTGDLGAILLREVLDGSGIVKHTQYGRLVIEEFTLR